MNYRNNNYYGRGPDRYTRPPRTAATPMINAALCFSVLALALSMTGYFGIMFGALSIILAALSKGGQQTMERNAKIALYIGLISLVISTVVMIVSIIMTINEYGSMQNYINYFLELSGQTVSSGNVFMETF